ncbi:hypothetical protein TNCV_2564501 [Trichonephila clavipes]|nr:hypothetical protein TNCV_2564501 [Trichonephila clavipes]
MTLFINSYALKQNVVAVVKWSWSPTRRRGCPVLSSGISEHPHADGLMHAQSGVMWKCEEWSTNSGDVPVAGPRFVDALERDVDKFKTIVFHHY